jgi:hypothetical protein
MQRTRLAAVLLSALLAAACALIEPPPAPVAKPAPPDLSAPFYRDAAARGEAVYAIDAHRSLAVMRVYRGGRLARFGHDHVVASRGLQGFALLARAAGESRADLYIPLDTLTVDEPALRAETGFETTPSAGDIEGTRRNMLDKVLEAERFPYALLRLRHATGERAAVTLAAEITLHGVTRTLPVAVELDTAAGELRALGSFSLNQTDFGMTPYSALGGALQVQDRVDVRFEIHARRL